MNVKAGSKLMNTRRLVSLIVIAFALQSAGCAVNVKPWERGNLAKEHMAIEPDALERTIFEQVVTSKEASSGGYAIVGGGCGCN